jgi:hypothetical protein
MGAALFPLDACELFVPVWSSRDEPRVAQFVSELPVLCGLRDTN